MEVYLHHQSGLASCNKPGTNPDTWSSAASCDPHQPDPVFPGKVRTLIYFLSTLLCAHRAHSDRDSPLVRQQRNPLAVLTLKGGTWVQWLYFGVQRQLHQTGLQKGLFFQVQELEVCLHFCSGTASPRRFSLSKKDVTH